MLRDALGDRNEGIEAEAWIGTGEELLIDNMLIWFSCS